MISGSTLDVEGNQPEFSVNGTFSPLIVENGRPISFCDQKLHYQLHHCLI